MCAGTEVKTQNDGPVGAIDRAGVADECFANGDRDSSSTNYGYISLANNASFLAPPLLSSSSPPRARLRKGRRDRSSAT